MDGVSKEGAKGEHNRASVCCAVLFIRSFDALFPPSPALGPTVGRRRPCGQQIMPLRAGAGWVAPKMEVEVDVEGYEAKVNRG